MKDKSKSWARTEQQKYLHDVLVGNFGHNNTLQKIDLAINQLDVYIQSARAEAVRGALEDYVKKAKKTLEKLFIVNTEVSEVLDDLKEYEEKK